ncbi:ABC transporter ATP-binding protein [Devosia geojensis]|nr:ABC transporter ATP-binding protein [Devosia geojensis]
MDTKAPMPAERLLDLEDVHVHFPMREGLVKAVNGVTYHVDKGEVLGIVGESGSGKSITARAIMRLLPRNAQAAGGRIRLRPRTGEEFELSALERNSRAVRQVRGNHIGMIFQEPMTALSPVHTIGDQICRTIQLHMGLDKRAARARAADLLARVRMPRPQQMLDNYPHQLSGGMRQRAMIALAISCNPSLLIADEPTTALDVTTEAQILDLLRELQAESGMAIVFITHNFGVVADIADRVAVMYLGRIVETASVDDIFYAPKHPYTRALLNSIPRLGVDQGRRLPTIPGMVPDPFSVPAGCAFNPRCTHAVAGVCDVETPPQRQFANGQSARCHFADTFAEAAHA